jgi:hypothetical protein
MSKRNEWVLLSDLPQRVTEAVRLYQSVTGDRRCVIRWYRSDAVGILTHRTIDVVQLARITTAHGIRVEVDGVAPRYTEVSLFMSDWQKERASKSRGLVLQEIKTTPSDYDSAIVRQDARDASVPRIRKSSTTANEL